MTTLCYICFCLDIKTLKPDYQDYIKSLVSKITRKWAKFCPKIMKNGQIVSGARKTGILSLHQPTQKVMSIYLDFSDATVELLAYAIVMLATRFASRKG